jgi:hypothetical protein
MRLGRVAVVCHRAFTERHLPGLDPLGQRVKLGRFDRGRPWLTVVGVVEGVSGTAGAAPVRDACRDRVALGVVGRSERGNCSAIAGASRQGGEDHLGLRNRSASCAGDEYAVS